MIAKKARTAGFFGGVKGLRNGLGCGMIGKRKEKSMKLLFLLGNAAVGKMTVGQEIAKKTGLRLFHNHMTIEPIIEIFGYYDAKIITEVREVIFKELAASSVKGVIFTYMMDFDHKGDWDYLAHVRSLFDIPEDDVFYAELVAPQEVRLCRNRTENRLKHKPSKRDVEVSDDRLIRADEEYRCESRIGEVPFRNYFRLDNSALSAEAAADEIIKKFSL